MSNSSSPRTARRLTGTLLVVALLGGGAFLWVQGNSPMSSDVQAAPRSKTPEGSVARPQPASAAEKNAAIKSIRGQLRAFDIGDWKSASAFQSRGLKGNFSSPAQFGAMIQGAYPAFIGARRVDFGSALSHGPMMQMQVRLFPRTGEPMDVLYMLVKEDGQYHISGVRGGMSGSGRGGGHPEPNGNNDSGGMIV